MMLVGTVVLDRKCDGSTKTSAVTPSGTVPPHRGYHWSEPIESDPLQKTKCTPCDIIALLVPSAVKSEDTPLVPRMYCKYVLPKVLTSLPGRY